MCVLAFVKKVQEQLNHFDLFVVLLDFCVSCHRAKMDIALVHLRCFGLTILNWLFLTIKWHSHSFRFLFKITSKNGKQLRNFGRVLWHAKMHRHQNAAQNIMHSICDKNCCMCHNYLKLNCKRGSNFRFMHSHEIEQQTMRILVDTSCRFMLVVIAIISREHSSDHTAINHGLVNSHMSGCLLLNYILIIKHLGTQTHPTE